MSAQSQDNAINSGKLTRALIYTVLLLFAFYYLLPLYVMLVNSFKPLEEIRQGGMLNLPQQWTIEPWLSAWSTAQIGVQPTGLKPFFINSILMVVPAVAISTIVGALNGYVLTKWQFRGSNIFSACCFCRASFRSRLCSFRWRAFLVFWGSLARSGG